MKIKITKKKIKNSYIKVTSELLVEVVVPEEATEKYINSLIKKRDIWIEKKLEFFKKYSEPKIEKKYISGETIRYLGRNYKLKVIQDKKIYVKYHKGHIHLYCHKNTDIKNKKYAIEKWIREHGKEKFNCLVKKHLKKMNIPLEGINIKFRVMKSRWGSYNSSKGEIIFNWKLFEKSVYGIEYVIVHELAHLKHNNHKKEFYNYITYLLPDWKKRMDSLYNN